MHNTWIKIIPFKHKIDFIPKVYAEDASKLDDRQEDQNNGDILQHTELTTERVKIGSFELVVIKTNRTLNKIFTAVLTILVVLNTINMGA